MLTDRWVWWRRAHLVASGLVIVMSLLHATVTPVLYKDWSPDTVWFLGTGLGLLLLGAANVAHIGVEPCRQPTTTLVRWANWLFFLFGIGAVVAVRELQAAVVLLGLVGQAVAAHWTLPGPTPESSHRLGGQ